MQDKRIGFAVTGSYCTFDKILPQMKKLAERNAVTPIFSHAVATTDTRFYKAADFYRDVHEICGRKPITAIVDAEPIGPGRLLDILVVAPCTGNTLAKLAASITDTPVLMAAKAHLRNDRPVVLAVSTNDALGGAAKNIGALLNYRNVYFVPMAQDDPVKKERSVVADYARLCEACEAALEGKQLQPIFFA
jgi:dipicolinate synthase subunit B